MRLTPSCFAVLVALSVPAALAHAQITIDRESVMLNPTNANERVADIVVRNVGVADVQASVQLEDWDVDAQGASHWRKSGAVAGSCGRRVSVSPSALHLAPGEQRVVRIALDAKAQFDSECWSAAVVQTTNASSVVAAKGPAVTDSGSSARTTVPLYVTPSGLSIDGEASDMYVKGDSLEVLFKNTGKQRTSIVGQIMVRSADDSLVKTVPLEAATVLAGATRRLRVAMPKLTKGKYVLVAVIDFGGEQLTAVEAALEIQ